MFSDGCWQRSCGCSPLSTVPLAYPTTGITEVLIGGVIVDPAKYRVDEWRELVRVDGAWWPSCQNLAADETEEGSFVVTYTHGVAPPPAGMLAAAQLACELWKACARVGDCKLPAGVTKVTRQGITIERGLLASWFRDLRTSRGWNTGLALVDAFLTAYNPNSLRRAPAVWSPDVAMMPRRAGT